MLRQVPCLSFLFKVGGHVGDVGFDKFLDGNSVFTDLPLSVFAVAELKKVEQIGKINSSPECDHHVLGQHATRLFTADAGVEELFIKRHAVLVVGVDFCHKCAAVKIGIGNGGLTVAFCLAPELLRGIKLHVDFGIAP